jgi:predicted nucleic acid-binding protein
MVYLDTSFIAPLVIAEDSSDAVEAYVLKLKPGEVTTSLWTQVELASLVSRKLRMGEFSGAEADAVRGEFDRVLNLAYPWVL